jgi:ATP-dependent Clp protease, protease subunit
MKPQDGEEQAQQSFTPWDEFAFESYQQLLKDRTILLNADITDNVIERVVLPLNALSQKSKKPIKLLLHSSGGSIEAGQAVVDAIITCPAPVTTIVFGKAMSASFDIFLAGSKRIMYPNSLIMMHSGASRLENLTLPQINKEAELHKEYFQRWSSWYASRTKVDKNEWLNMLNNGLNYYFFPEECLKLGLAHEVVQIPKRKSK